MFKVLFKEYTASRRVRYPNKTGRVLEQIKIFIVIIDEPGRLVVLGMTAV